MSAASRSPLDAWVDRGVRQPIAHPVAADDDHFLASKGRLKVTLRVLRRRLELRASGQAAHRAERIEGSWQRALWIAAEAPQIGDSLMDLAPRSLLVGHGIAVDLLAAPGTAALFAGDRGFRRVVSDERQIVAAGHDFVIVDSHSWRALAAKRRCVPELPWVSLKGDYLGYDYQRALFATRRLAELLGVELAQAEEDRHARQKLWLDEGDERIGDEANDGDTAPMGHAAAPPRIALALGGVRTERSYRHWPEVARRLRKRTGASFVLLGSSNGESAARTVAGALPPSSWTDLVARSDLHGTRQAIRDADLVLAADGGLMHLALTTATPMVALFDASVDPAWRLPPDFGGVAIRAATHSVSSLSPRQVSQVALDVLAGRAAHA